MSAISYHIAARFREHRPNPSDHQYISLHVPVYKSYCSSQKMWITWEIPWINCWDSVHSFWIFSKNSDKLPAFRSAIACIDPKVYFFTIAFIIHLYHVVFVIHALHPLCCLIKSCSSCILFIPISHYILSWTWI